MNIQELLESKKKKSPIEPEIDDFSDDEDPISDPDQDDVPNIVMQLRGAVDVDGDRKIHFKDGSKIKLPLNIIQLFLLKYLELRPQDREEMQDKASQSLNGFKEALTSTYARRPNKTIYAYK